MWQVKISLYTNLENHFKWLSSQHCSFNLQHKVIASQKAIEILFNCLLGSNSRHNITFPPSITKQNYQVTRESVSI